MKKIANIFLILFSLVLIQSCDEEEFESSIVHVSFGNSTYAAGVDIGGSATVNVMIYSTNTTGSDRSFNVVVDGSGAGAGSFTVPTSITIPSGSNEGTMAVALSDSNLGIGVNRVSLSFDNVLDGHGNGGSTTIEYTQNCAEVTAVFDINFDSYPGETGWHILDSLGGVVTSGGGYGGLASTTENITLCQGRSYTFVLTDSFGDGMLGTYTLTIGGVVKVTGGGTDFGTSESNAFDTN